MKELEPYFSAYARASDRTRSVYFIILTFSVLCLATSLKSLETGWNNRMMRKVKLAYVYLKSEFPNEKDPVYVPLTLNEIQEAKEFQSLVKFRTADDAKSALETARRRVSDGSQFTVPLFGLSFHPNDLGLISGACLFFLLLILKQALAREQENFHLVTEKAQQMVDTAARTTTEDKPENIYKCAYDMLSTYEVLHRPESRHSSTSSFFSRMLIDVSMVMIGFPLLAYAVVCSNDIRTRELGYYISPDYTTFLLGFEVVMLICICYLVISCHMIVRETRSLWVRLNDKSLAFSRSSSQV